MKMKGKMKGIYLESRYTLFISLIYFYKIKNDIFYFINDNMEKNLNLRIIKCIILKKIEKKDFLYSYRKWRESHKLLKIIKNFEEIYLQDHITYSQFFLNNFKGKISLLEDGSLNYNIKLIETEANRKIKKIKINKYFRKCIIEKRKKEYKIYGLSEKISKIYLTGVLPIPNLIKDKVEIINIKEIWSNLSQEAKKEILEVFNMDIKKFQILKEDDRKILLLTQPLSEDKIIIEEEKIKIYREIIEKQNGRKIYIKAHPREKTNYKEVFKNFNIEVIENTFPIELFLLLNIKFDKVITLFSTGALNFKGKAEVEFIGTEKYPKLYERFGKIEMK